MVGSRVYVGGLPYGVRERDLERFFKGYGRTRDILIKNGYGFVVSNLQVIFINKHRLNYFFFSRKSIIYFGIFFLIAFSIGI